jgi:hypothetical protein
MELKCLFPASQASTIKFHWPAETSSYPQNFRRCHLIFFFHLTVGFSSKSFSVGFFDKMFAYVSHSLICVTDSFRCNPLDFITLNSYIHCSFAVFLLNTVTKEYARKISYFGAFANLQKVTISFVMSVNLSPRNSSAPTRQIFMKFGILFFSKICRKKIKFH